MVMLNTRQEYLSWDNRETVTYTVYGLTQNTSGYVESYTGITAKRRAISNRDVPTQRTGIFTADDLVWLLPSAVVPTGVRPNPNDYLTDTAGRVWTVLETQLNNLQSTWRLVTRNLVLAEALRQVCGLYRPSNSKDAAGGRVASDYTLILGNVPCRIQETGTEATDILGKKQVKTRYEIYCGLRLNWKSTDRIIDGLGVVYQIVSGTAPDVMDTLQILTVERIL